MPDCLTFPYSQELEKRRGFHICVLKEQSLELERFWEMHEVISLYLYSLN